MTIIKIQKSHAVDHQTNCTWEHRQQSHRCVHCLCIAANARITKDFTRAGSATSKNGRTSPYTGIVADLYILKRSADAHAPMRGLICCYRLRAASPAVARALLHVQFPAWLQNLNGTTPADTFTRSVRLMLISVPVGSQGGCPADTLGYVTTAARPGLAPGPQAPGRARRRTAGRAARAPARGTLLKTGTTKA